MVETAKSKPENFFHSVGLALLLADGLGIKGAEEVPSR